MDERRQHDFVRRILIVDDTSAIHRDFDKVLAPAGTSASERALAELDELMFADEEAKAAPNLKTESVHKLNFELDHAYQGEEGLRKIILAQQNNSPFSVAFVDMRMPPGWDGLRTIREICKVDSHVQIVICSAYSDYSWAQITEAVGCTDRLLILKKPFDQAEVYQLAAALSEKWIAEAETRELLAELEGKVARRTAALTESNGKLRLLNEELKLAAEEARSSERAKGRFLATMSHEIRTTLNGIIGASNMLNTSKALSDSDQELANIIQTSGDALMIVINDILDYSKYENGQLELESIPFSLAALVDECSSLLAPSMEQNNVLFRAELDDSLPSVVIGDPARLRQILLNLLNNATKFGKNAPVTLRISSLARQADSVQLQIEIQDRGIGMNAETKDRLFSAFMQADSSTTRKFGGTGLGLAICKLLADAMKADIYVESEPGAGSTFFLKLSMPISDTVVEELGSPRYVPTSPSPGVEQSNDYSNKRVLFVDDNAINRKLGMRFLKRLKVDGDFARDGIEALDKTKREHFDLVLMDLQMPEMDGFEATREIRKREAASGSERLPIVALTANAFSEIREQSHDAGMDDFLTKPLHIHELDEMLERWLLTNANA